MTEPTEQEFLEDNIATVAHHLRQDSARLSVSHSGYKAGLEVDPGEVLAEIARRLTAPRCEVRIEDKEIAKQIGLFLGMSGLTPGDVAHIRDLVGAAQEAGNCDTREVLLFSSYCGGENSECTEVTPCPNCLRMSNVFRVPRSVLTEYVRELYSGGPKSADPYSGPSVSSASRGTEA